MPLVTRALLLIITEVTHITIYILLEQKTHTNRQQWSHLKHLISTMSYNGDDQEGKIVVQIQSQNVHHLQFNICCGCDRPNVYNIKMLMVTTRVAKNLQEDTIYN